MHEVRDKMGYSHEIILPNEEFPFKMFLFEGKDGNYVRGNIGIARLKFLQFLKETCVSF